MACNDLQGRPFTFGLLWLFPSLCCALAQHLVALQLTGRSYFIVKILLTHAASGCNPMDIVAALCVAGDSIDCAAALADGTASCPVFLV